MKKKKSTVKADFFADSKIFEPSIVTEILGVLPDYIWDERKEKKWRSQGRTWEYSSGTIEGTDIYDALQNVEAMFTPRIEKLLQLKEFFDDIEYSIEMVASIENYESVKIEFRPSTFEFLERINGKMAITIYEEYVGIYRLLYFLRDIIWRLEDHTPRAIWKRRQRRKKREQEWKEAQAKDREVSFSGNEAVK